MVREKRQRAVFWRKRCLPDIRTFTTALDYRRSQELV